MDLLRAMDLLDDIESALLPIVTDDGEDGYIMPVSDQWVDTEIEITLDSGCCEHVMDIADAPGYGTFIAECAGSKKRQNLIVGNGQKVPNQGPVILNMQTDSNGIGMPQLIRSTFQVAEVTRPLMSVGRICDMGFQCNFMKNEAIILDANGGEVTRFQRVGGLYVAKLILKKPEPFVRPAQ